MECRLPGSDQFECLLCPLRVRWRSGADHPILAGAHGALPPRKMNRLRFRVIEAVGPRTGVCSNRLGGQLGAAEGLEALDHGLMHLEAAGDEVAGLEEPIAASEVGDRAASLGD